MSSEEMPRIFLELKLKTLYPDGSESERLLFTQEITGINTQRLEELLDSVSQIQKICLLSAIKAIIKTGSDRKK